jgi:ubiquinone/menaquinone biosynthesis C-methylase UbiE
VNAPSGTVDPVGKLATTGEWQALARIDPFYAVASWPGKRGSWTREEFYELGRSDWADAVKHWLQYEPQLRGTCVEIGCGAGRMTAPLAGHFDRVVGVDVSEDMVALAREAAPGAEFVIVSGTELPLANSSADAVFTTHVLQHLDGIETVRDYLREMYRILRPGGTAMIHVALGARRSRFRSVLDSTKLRMTRTALARGIDWFHYHGERYTSEEIRALLSAIGFRDIELRDFAMRSNGDPHPFWLVRR